MKILGIESSCDETAASVVEDGRKVLSNVIASSLNEHKLYGGVVPEIASRRHAESISFVVKQALYDANCSINNIDAIAVTYAPGLIGSLLVGVNFAKGLSLANNIPLVPVHHIRGHVASNYISNNLEPEFLSLIVSGGHSHIVAVNDYTDYKIIGRTRDDAAGEALDKAGRTMKLEYPGGVSIDKISKLGNKEAFSFPKPKVDNAPYDFSFSGLKTSVLNIINKAQMKNDEINIPDLAASFQHAVVNCLITNLEKAAKDFNYNKIAIAGGVSANSELRSEVTKFCKNNNYELFMPELKYCGDNGSMIASQGYYEYIKGYTASSDLNAYATKSIDENYKLS